MKLIIYVDGGARPNPGHGGYGVWICRDGNGAYGRGVYVGNSCTNNLAEYLAMDAAIAEVMKIHKDEHPVTLHVTIYADSELVVKQVHGDYAVKNNRLRPIHARITANLESLRRLGIRITIAHVPRAENGMADALSTKAIIHKESITLTMDPTQMQHQGESRIYPASSAVSSKPSKKRARQQFDSSTIKIPKSSTTNSPPDE